MSAPASSFSDLNPAGLVEILLTTSLNGTMLLRPLYAADGQELVDFAWERLNPAAQQLLNLPERPTDSFLTLFPTALEMGVFSFYRDAFQSGRLVQHENLYQHDGLDGYYVLQAQRCEGILVVSFADGNDQSRSRVEEALRTSQARERAARAMAERQQGELERVFKQAPVAIAVYRGPHYIIELANPTVCRLWGRTQEEIIGKGLFEALPEVAGMGFEELLDGVMATGEPHVARAMPAVHERNGRRDTVYWDFVYVAMHEDDGRIYGAMVVATEVTEQVRARQQVQQLNEALEVRVRERTAEAHAALRETQEQQDVLRQILHQVPASVATLMGPEHRFAFFNDQYYALSGNRATLGQSVADVLPELAEQGFLPLLDRVYATGEPFKGQEISILLEQPAGPATQRYIDLSYQPLTDRQGQVQGILVFIVDVTEQVRTRRQADTLQAAALAAVQRRAQQRQELYQIFAQTPVAIVLLREPDHRIDYFNPAFEELFPPDGWTGNDMQGHLLAEVYPRIKMAGLVELLDRVFETGEPQVVLDMPLANLQPGSPRYVTFTYQAYLEGGRIVGVSAFAYDVTEQVVGRRDAEILQAALLARAQRSAEERQELLSLFERAPVAVALLREPGHRIEYYNAAFAELYPAQHILGQPVVEVYPGMASPDVIGRLDRVYATGETYQGLEQPLRTAAPGGPTRYITFTYQAYREHDRIAGVAVFIHEVTEQVLARQAREARETDLQQMFEQTPVAICVFQGPDYCLELVNPLMGDMLGHSPAQLLNRPFFEALPELANQGLRELLDEVRRSGTAFVAQEQPVKLARHGAEFGYFNFVYQPLKSVTALPRVVCVAIEVTEQVLARQQVQQLNQEMQLTNAELHDTNARLIRTNTDLDTFVYTASHDLKAPISNIEGLLLALRQQLPPEALQAPLVPRLFGMMEDSVIRFQQTIGHLTDISQLQQAEAPETIDLADLIAGVHLDLAPLIEAAPVALSIAVEDCQAVRVAPKTLRSVVYNLLSNAVKYRAPDRAAQVQLRAQCTPTQLVLAVQDNGLGLNPAQQAELFGMFRRLHVHVEGSGVGLFMVKRLVENAGGTITVDSQPGVGSTFTVSLPA
ncbi:PAS domain-containing sensor histidine kinase [Hymenobacter terrestris]|uniref:histidine kinase n=1 Tax=Hymenobacter terrestris TaxID=2748310 RepID=A0ABX2Q373_9BACT|nr:PAS domain-containing protein [Hymenobacter terrestris]NVO85398.1 PAS domain-containing sensor histidine kinase [Hymenobacter terrestris]